MMPFALRLLACSLLTVAVSSTISPAQAQTQTPEAFWRGKTVVAFAPTGTGGGYDSYTRLVARHIGKYIPGHPQVVVQNMPGAGGMVLANHLYNVAAKDGTAYGLLDRGIPTAPLLYGEGSKARFDVLKFTWLGSMAREAGVGVVSTQSPAKSIEEARTREVFFGSTGQETDAATYVRLFNELLGTRIKVISSYPSQPEIFLSIERGELHGVFVTGFSGSAKKYVDGKIAEGKMKLIVQTTLKKDPALAGVPGILDFVTKDEDRKVIELLLSRLSLGRPFVAPPGVPADRVAALQEAFKKVLDDPELRAEADKLGLPIDPILADEAQSIIKTLYAYPPAVVERTQKLVRAQ